MSILTFNFNGKKVRTVFDSSGNAWFSLDDIVSILEYKNITEMKRNLGSWDRAVFGIPTTNQNGITHERKMNAINESGLYSAINNSRKQDIMAFKGWIINEVLPSIRRTWANTINSKKPKIPFSEAAAGLEVIYRSLNLSEPCKLQLLHGLAEDYGISFNLLPD